MRRPPPALWLVPRYGLAGAIAAHMISTAAVFLFVVVCVRVVLKVALPWGDLARVMAASLCAAALSLGALVITDNPSSLHQILVGILYILTYMAGTLVFKVWNQYDLAMLGNLGKNDPREIAPQYFSELMKALKKCATRRTHTNVLQHISGYLKQSISPEDKQEVQYLIGQYLHGIVPLIVPLTLLKHHFRLHPDPYISRQVYLQPHPENLSLRNAI